MSLTALRARIASLNDVLCATSLLIWDSRTMMPSGGATTRASQIATLTRVARDILTAPETLRALEAAEAEVAALPDGARDRREVAQVRHAADLHLRVSPALTERRAMLRGLANVAWMEARAKNEFSIFLPHLELTVAAAREYAQAIGYAAHPYDALISLYEPGETCASLATLFGKLRTGIAPILAARLARPAARRDFLFRDFPEADQLRMARHFADLLDYDGNRGRLDVSVHPFEISLTRHDVRITTRARRDYLPPALFGAMHETGHALYEQNVRPEFTRTVFASDLVGLYGVGGTSFGAHESQSRLWENHVGRSRDFWNLHFPALQTAFPAALAGVDAAMFHAAVTQPEPGLIRTDADELTYDFHVMLRVECEAGLIDGSLKARDVPAFWSQSMQKHLGLTPKDDALGCLQDIHWSSGMIGSFCSYTIGNVMAAQLMQAAHAQNPRLGETLRCGDYAPLRAWLRENIWQHGRSFTRDELLLKATGQALDTSAYLAYLAAT